MKYDNGLLFILSALEHDWASIYVLLAFTDNINKYSYLLLNHFTVEHFRGK